MPNLKAKVVTLTNRDKTIVKYPTSLTDAIFDLETGKKLIDMLNETAISVNTLQERDKIPASQRANRRLVRVENDGTGKTQYYTWDAMNSVWDIEQFGFKIETLDDVPEVIRNSITWKKLGNGNTSI